MDKPGADVFVQELKLLSGDMRNLEKIKRLLLGASAGPLKESDLYVLFNHRILTVRSPSGFQSLESSSSDFLIADRPEHGQLFQSRAPLLSFTIEELHNLKHLLLLMGLGERFTYTVEEATSVEQAFHQPTLTQDFRTRAYLFCRFVLPRLNFIRDS